MMEDISKAIELAIAAFKEKFGEDNTMKQKFIGGQPIKIDHTLKIYESEE